jgi:putative hemolysin
MQHDETPTVHEKLIDIRRLIASKNPGLLRIIPGFIIAYLKRITHQESVNGYVYKHRDKFGLSFAQAILTEFGVAVQVVDGRSPAGKQLKILASDRKYIVASNHPLGGIDGMALMQELGRFRQDIIFPVNDLLMNLPGLKPLFIPINKHGKNIENARLIDEAFASDKVILYFPAGLVSRKQRIDGQSIIRDLEWKTTFIKKAKKYQRDIVPVYVDGRNSNWFYNLARWRKRLGIKANIEMLYLVDEMMRQRHKTISIVIGDPIPWTTFDKTKNELQWAAWVRDKVYTLGKAFQRGDFSQCVLPPDHTPYPKTPMV